MSRNIHHYVAAGQCYFIEVNLFETDRFQFSPRLANIPNWKESKKFLYWWLIELPYYDNLCKGQLNLLHKRSG